MSPNKASPLASDLYAVLSVIPESVAALKKFRAELLSDLSNRVEALVGPDREIDAEICIALDWAGRHCEGAINIRTDVDWEGDLLFEIDGDPCCNPIPALTASYDVVVDLIKGRYGLLLEQVRNSDGVGDRWRAIVPVFSETSPYRWLTEAIGTSISPAMAVLSAYLRAVAMLEAAE